MKLLKTKHSLIILTIAIILLILLVSGFAFGASTSVPTAKVKAPVESIRNAEVKKRPLQKQRSPLINPQKAKPVLTQKAKPVLRSAITHLKIGTESDGRWFWEATIKNTGNVELDEQNVTVQVYKFSSFQGTWTAATGSIIRSKSISPGQSRVIKNYWSRCCTTDKLKIELRDRKRHLILDTRTLTSLVFSPSQYKPLNVRVKQIEWIATTRLWRATLKNFSQFTVKLRVMGTLDLSLGLYGWPVWNAVGADTITISPEGEASTMWLGGGGSSGIGPGRQLSVIKYFLMDCTQFENAQQCGYSGEHDDITIPNSNTVFTFF